ncbi:MAG: PilX N-terminal domain-containing pilus assembly protein [Sedimenticola sp.]|nr:PilX N-terminal domain-containing pilus assembly protein [Sedimenticola sp.]
MSIYVKTEILKSAAVSLQRMNRQSGAALIMSLLLLTVMTLISVTSMQSTLLEEKMAGNTRDRQLSFQAAEAAIHSGEEFLQANTFDSANYTDACSNGLCTRREDDATYVRSAAPGNTGWVDPRWDLSGSLNVWADGSGKYREYGIVLAGTYKKPRYIIEFAGYIPADIATNPSPASTPPTWYPAYIAPTAGWQAEWAELYRITALGFGGSPNARSMVQTMYSKSL